MNFRRAAFSSSITVLRHLEEGQLSIDNNPVERALRGVAIGRNYVQSAIMLSST
jgi:hypothetical protein